MILPIRQKIDDWKNNLPLLIDQEEKSSIIHGDFRADNIVVGKEETYILDYDQGVNGGDPFYDLTKLLVFDQKEEPDTNKRFLYLPTLTIEEKMAVAKEYLLCLQNKGAHLPSYLVDYVYNHKSDTLIQRDRLHNFENIISVMIYRNMLGWNFYVDETPPGRRGVKFIAEMLVQSINL